MLPVLSPSMATTIQYWRIIRCQRLSSGGSAIKTRRNNETKFPCSCIIDDDSISSCLLPTYPRSVVTNNKHKKKYIIIIF